MRLNVVKENKPIIHLPRTPNEKETHIYFTYTWSQRGVCHFHFQLWVRRPGRQTDLCLDVGADPDHLRLIVRREQQLQH